MQLNMGNAQSHSGEACHPGLLFGRYEEQGEPLLLFGNTLPWNLCLNAVPGETHAPAAATELAKHLKQSGIVIHGLNAVSYTHLHALQHQGEKARKGRSVNT